jgi:hypothetical protein
MAIGNSFQLVKAKQKGSPAGSRLYVWTGNIIKVVVATTHVMPSPFYAFQGNASFSANGFAVRTVDKSGLANDIIARFMGVSSRSLIGSL